MRGHLLFAALLIALSSFGCAQATIYVPDDYAKIQWAVDNASDGDTIIVRDGTYIENIEISKRITLRSENGSANCIIQAANAGDHVISIFNTFNVVVEGFSIKGATSGGMAGVYLRNTTAVTLRDVNITECYYGVYMNAQWSQVNYTTIEDSKIEADENGVYIWKDHGKACYNKVQRCEITANTGISIVGGWATSIGNEIRNNTITCDRSAVLLTDQNEDFIVDGNRIEDTGRYDPSIWLKWCAIKNGVISNNIISTARDWGIRVEGGENITISGNTVKSISICGGSSNKLINNNVAEWIELYHTDYPYMRGNSMGKFRIYGEFDVHPYYNESRDYDADIDTSNTVNGKPIYYYTHQSGITLDGVSAGYIGFYDCSNVEVRNVNIEGNLSECILILKTTDARIIDNTLKNNFPEGSLRNWGIHVGRSSDVLIHGNEIVLSRGHGISGHRVLYSEISANEIEGFGGGIYGGGGIMLDNSDYCVIRDNILNTTRSVHAWHQGINIGGEHNIIANNTIYGNNLLGKGIVTPRDDYLGIEDYNNTIENNRIFDTRDVAIHAGAPMNCKIINNYVEGCSGGLLLSHYYGSGGYNLIEGNRFENIKGGSYIMEIDTNSHNVIRNNIFANSSGVYGVIFSPSFDPLRPAVPRNNTLRNNIFFNMSKAAIKIRGPFIWGGVSYNGVFYQNIDASNTFDGKPIYYLTNLRDTTLDVSDGVFYGMINCSNVVVRNALSENGFKNIMVVDCSNVTLENATMLHTEQANLYLNNVTDSTFKDIYMYHVAWSGRNNLYAYNTRNTLFENITADANTDRVETSIMLQGCTNNGILNSTITRNSIGIKIIGGESNSIENCSISNHGNYGVFLKGTSNNTVNRSIITNCQYGVRLKNSNNNILSRNNIAASRWGICVENSYNNKIYLNNFNNTDNVYSYASTNFWNSTHQINYTYNGIQYTNYLGNYWSDYTGNDSDGDGIGDTPYSIDSDKDYYPLIERFENYFAPAPTPTPTPTPMPTPTPTLTPTPTPIPEFPAHTLLIAASCMIALAFMISMRRGKK